MAVLWCNGRWLDASDFSARPADRGLMHGLGLFETILAVNGRPVFADKHVSRLAGGCARLGWNPALPDPGEALPELLDANNLLKGRARIRLAVTAGSGPVGDLAQGIDHLVWMSAAATAGPPQDTNANLSPWTRNEGSALAGLKSASYAENLIALDHARRLGFGETVFLNNSGAVCEAATSNVFVVRDGRVRTPSPASGCLPGITRGVVIETARSLGIPCEETDVALNELHLADEIFLTSSTRGVVGLSRFEDRTFDAGPLTAILRRAWHEAAIGKSGA